MSDSTDFSPPPRGFTSEELIRWERVRQRLRAELGDAIYDFLVYGSRIGAC